MKKNKTMRLASVLLIAVLMTTSVISGTFAKYTSDATITDAARVAKWSFTVKSATADDATDIATSETFEFEVFKTVSDTNVATAEDGKDAIIAPGTTGNLSVELENASEVNAKYTVSFTANEATVPLQWSATGKAGTWKDDITELNISEANINMDEKATVALYWKWAFVDDDVVEQTDEADTQLGIGGSAAPSVTITVAAEQVD